MNDEGQSKFIVNIVKDTILLIQFTVAEKKIPVSVRCCRQHLHTQFLENIQLTDARQIDKLVFESQLQLKDMRKMRRNEVMAKFLPNNYIQMAQTTDKLGNILKV